MFDKWQKARAEPNELNLIPVMNLMVVLIPMLLLGAAFFHISVIPASIAQEGGGGGKPSPKVTMKVQVEPDRLVLAGHSGDPSVDHSELMAVFPARDGRFDLELLQAKLELIKAKYPSSDTVVIAPHDDLPYQTLIAIVDTVREKLEPQGDGAEPKRKVLFPLTVFAQPGPELPPAGEVLEGVPLESVPVEGGAP